MLARIVQKGIGIGISKWASTEEIILAVDTVIRDKRYLKTKVIQRAFNQFVTF